MVRLLFSILCVLAIIVEGIIILFIRKSEKALKHARGYQLCCLESAITIFSYLISINTESYFITSLSSSIYFVSIDVLLFQFLYLMLDITGLKLNSFQKSSIIANKIYATFDVIVLLINPFKEIAIHYIRTQSSEFFWQYDSMLLYKMHLIFCYFIILQIVLVLIQKMLTTPKLYHSRYSLIIEGLLVIVILNCMFLYLPVLSFFKFDISVLLYSAETVLIFYNATYYAQRKLLKDAPVIVVDEMRHPVIMFDCEQNFALRNEAASIVIPDSSSDLTLERFIDTFCMNEKITDISEDVSFQWPFHEHVYRCDYEVLKKKDLPIAYVFTFTESSTEYDLLTGFHLLAAALRDFKDIKDKDIMPSGVLICDVNRLSEINENYGRDIGDQVVAATAQAMRDICPEGTYFARMHDAFLMAVVPNTNFQQMKSIGKDISSGLVSNDTVSGGIGIEYAFAMMSFIKSDIQEAIISAEYGIKVKKLMDQGSTHSSLLFSLMKIMQESDPDTRQHVMRTRILGEKFAQRINLTDEDTAMLSLLCVLHDIGKLGIPLEILNKPGKLTKQEWELLKTHAVKGYEIAKASRVLEPIADMILCHHECWDGNGYPGGLSQEEIPLLSRIISVVDAYDAMISDRPYRKGMSRHEALKELEKYAGTQFDPYIVSEFMLMIKEEDSYISEPESEIRTDASNWQKASELHDLPLDDDCSLSPVLYSRYVLSVDGETILSADDHFEELTGYTSDDVSTGLLTQSKLVFPDELDKYNSMKQKMLESNNEAFIEHKLRMKDGTSRNVFCHGWIFFDSSVKEYRVQIEVSDLSNSLTLKTMLANERLISRRNLEMWKDSIRKDPLTGILNRSTFRSELQTAIIADDKISVMLMCDLDNFKEYNDSYGHIEGDKLLRTFAQILSDNVMDNGIVCRMGGDEFAIALFFDYNAPLDVVNNQSRILWENVQRSLLQYDLDVSVSMGATMTRGKEKNFSQLYRESDNALYSAKNKGKKCLVTTWENSDQYILEDY